MACCYGNPSWEPYLFSQFLFNSGYNMHMVDCPTNNIIEHLAKGDFGEIYSAKHKESNLLVVIKRVKRSNVRPRYRVG